MKLLNEMMETGCDPDVIVINSLIYTLYKADRVDEAWDLFKKMKEMNLSPTVVTYDTLLAGLRKEGRVQEAIILFESMVSGGPPTNTITFNTLLDCICKNDSVNLALKFLNQMPFLNCRPDVFTYNTIIFGLTKKIGIVKCGKVDDALKITKEIIHRVRNRPDKIFWKDLIKGITSDATLESSIQFVEGLISNGTCINDSVIIPLIKTLCK
ncbi:Pentatricopeptide repeat-containing protein [Artemisia annua]|uniref:Pentatricopeptide repeat-containing protein n=1 Tax=Artemisia annua TaxID=35608 RepID=A0A2U1L1E8_ARTAN|nr:Pentatricopeptide repeat-containing protein [Artemisia annua]